MRYLYTPKSIYRVPTKYQSLLAWAASRPCHPGANISSEKVLAELAESKLGAALIAALAYVVLLHKTQRAQYCLIKQYTLNHIGVLNMI